MIRGCIFILFYFILNIVSAQEVVIKKVIGNVKFVLGEKKIKVVDYAVFSNKEGVFIIEDVNSQLVIRVGDKLDLLTFSETQNQFQLIDLISLDNPKEQEENGFLDKLLSLFSVPDNSSKKIGDMVIADQSGVKRSIFLDSNHVLLSDIIIMEDYPFKIDFSDFLNKSISQGDKFNIFLKDTYTKQEIANQITEQTFFIIDPDSIKSSFTINWNLEISHLTSQSVLKTRIKSINNKKKDLFDILKSKAILESNTDQCIYQILFIDRLRLHGLLANANYYLDLFIKESNCQSELLKYKEQYF
tara:strand:+ start:796 stop:1698 length:903 start_codon:yes stop_codon:yes gene_type:complete